MQIQREVYFRSSCGCGAVFETNWWLLNTTWWWHHERMKHSGLRTQVIEQDSKRRWCSNCEIQMRHNTYRNLDGNGWYTIYHCPRCKKVEWK